MCGCVVVMGSLSSDIPFSSGCKEGSNMGVSICTSSFLSSRKTEGKADSLEAKIVMQTCCVDVACVWPGKFSHRIGTGRKRPVFLIADPVFIIVEVFSDRSRIGLRTGKTAENIYLQMATQNPNDP